MYFPLLAKIYTTIFFSFRDSEFVCDFPFVNLVYDVELCHASVIGSVGNPEVINILIVIGSKVKTLVDN